MKTISLLAALAIVAAPLSAQTPEPKPPEQLKKFDRLIGVWAGKGKVRHELDQPPQTWTSKTVVEPILGGMFLRETMTISFPDMTETLQFVSVYGYDRENGKYKQWSVNNMGEVTEAELHWVDDDTFMSGAIAVTQGSPHVDRWVTHLGDETHSFRGDTAGGDGEFFVHVEGSVTRVKAMEAAAHKDAAFMVPGAGEEMAKLNRMAGTYDVEGAMFMPDGSKMPISGVQTMKPIYAGTILESHTIGQPNYEAWGWMGWNAHENRYEMVYVNSMGEAGHHPLYWSGNDLVAVFAGRSMGQPTVRRSASAVDENGVVTRAWTHAIMAAGEPMRLFDAKYTKR